MATSYPSFTIYHGSYEARETAFSQSVAGLIPCKFAGPHRFWKEFGRISREGLQRITAQNTAYITSNPRDCLAFGSAYQVLSAARMMASGSGTRSYSPPIEEIAARFGLAHTLDQPIRTLSGGETVKLALAKVGCMASVSSKLSISSPFTWLSAGNRHLLEGVVAQYQNLKIPVEIFSLNGEDDLNPVSPAYGKWISGRKISCRIHARNVKLPLGTMISTLSSNPAIARVEDTDMEILSPCLIAGENGQGKSLIAKALCNAIGSTGHLWLKTEGKKGSSRLLFQDVITQTLLRNANAIAQSPGCPDPGRAMSIFKSIRETCVRFHGEISRSGDHGDIHPPPGKNSLLETKILLVAVRLSNHPTALIMDEPDWGLTRNAAIAFVMAAIKSAHEFGVPVFLISHKPWWSPITRSTITVTKKPDSVFRFTIGIMPGSPAAK